MVRSLSHLKPDGVARVSLGEVSAQQVEREGVAGKEPKAHIITYLGPSRRGQTSRCYRRGP